MKKNYGKIFEQDIKDSIKDPSKWFFYRLRDNAASFGSKEKDTTRFTTSNICDCFVMSMKNLFLLELKTHAGASIPFSCIRKNQIVQMAKVNHARVKAYFILNYRDKDQTFAVKARDLKSFMDSTTKKSIPLAWCIENGVPIGSYKKISRYTYQIEPFFENVNLFD